jgi:aryl-alcohol dehydrogenase-like predicted oxidoreductase
MLPQKIVLGGESIKYLNQKSVNRLFDYASAHGINCIDTAPSYGDSENLIGNYLKRHNFKVSTKIGSPGGLLNPNGIVSSVDKSLRSLKLEQIYCIYIHSVDPKLISDQVIDQIESLVQTGKIFSFGYSGDGHFLNSAISKSNVFPNFMCTYNIVDQGNYSTIIGNPDLNWIFKRPLANGVWDYSFSKRILSIRQFLLGVEDSHKSDEYWNRFNLLKEFCKLEKISLSMLVGYIDVKVPSAKIAVGVRSIKHLSQLLKCEDISKKNLSQISEAWNIISKNYLEIRT